MLFLPFSLDWLADVPRNQALKDTTILVYKTMGNVGVVLRPLTSLTAMLNLKIAWGLQTNRVMTKTATNVLEVQTKPTCTA